MPEERQTEEKTFWQADGHIKTDTGKTPVDLQMRMWKRDRRFTG